MSKHTPGPWEAEHYRTERDINEPGYYAISSAVLDHYRGPVADTLNRDHRISPDEDEANARLIAAAPDLLDACNGLLGLLQLIEGRCDAELLEIIMTNHRVVDAKVIIAKATGES